MINLKVINEDNFLDAFQLKLADGQEKYVSNPIRSLAQAYVYRKQCQPFGIYDGDEMVGYVMVIYDYDIPEYDIWHMMIDASRQERGYGSEALRLVLEYIKTKPFGDSNRVTLTCNKDNQVALKVYHKAGFVETGEEDDEEIELSLTLYQYIKLREMPVVKEKAAEWFHSKWGVSKEAYLECMNAYLKKETEYGWYLCIDGETIVGGLGVIENDFHDRKDLTPNVCAVYTEENYRGKGIAGKLLNMVVEDMKEKGVSPLYLITDHTSFYERYGWEFLCMVQGDGEEEMTRMYIHR